MAATEAHQRKMTERAANWSDRRLARALAETVSQGPWRATLEAEVERRLWKEN